MEADLRQNIAHAGMKLGGGLFLIAAVLGIRIVTATPSGVEGDIAELEAAEAGWSADVAEVAEGAERVEVGSKSEALEAAVVRSRALSTRSSARSQDAERLVSCNIGGATQFMRAADCATRGGHSIDVKPRKN